MQRISTVASDMHIGWEYSNIEKIHNFLDTLQNLDTDIMVLNGDILDLWRSKYSTIVKKHKYLLDRINATSARIPTIWIRGNHDWYVPQREFPHIAFMTSYDTERIHIEHGHMMDVKQRRWSWTYKYIIRYFPTLYQRFMKSPSQIILEEDENTFLPIHAEAGRYAVKHDKDVVVIGHTHHRLVKQFEGYTVADCGDFVDSCSYARIIEDDNSIFTTVLRV